RAVCLVLHAAAKRMRAQAPIAGSELRGKLIQTASIAAYRGGLAHMPHYAASKAGIVSITRTAAQVLAADRITSNCICPGAVDTPMWKKIDAQWSKIEGWQIDEAWKRRTSFIPVGRPETADDVAGVVSFLASRDENRKRAQPRLATRQFARHSDAFAAPAVCSRTISAGGVTRSNDERRCYVLAFHEPAPAGRACGAGQRLRVAAPLTLHGTPPHRARIEHALSRLRTVVNS